jgi:hypothetical protein
MRFLTRIKEITIRDRIRNEIAISAVNIKPIELVIGEGQLSWLGHMYRYVHRMKEDLQEKFAKPLERRERIK